ncbi:hypothetical protein MKX01_039224, partial [Papaver californicum]
MSLQQAMAIQWLCFTSPSTTSNAEAITEKLFLRALIHRYWEKLRYLSCCATPLSISF